MVQEVETEESGVSWLIVGGGGRQVRQRVGKSRARGSKSNGDWCGWTVALEYKLVGRSGGWEDLVTYTAALMLPRISRSANSAARALSSASTIFCF